MTSTSTINHSLQLNPTLLTPFACGLILIVTGCFDTSTNSPVDTTSNLSGINDTGVNLYTQTFTDRLANDPPPIALSSTLDTNAPGQDADKGKDANPDVSNNDGIGGFNFTKLDSTGQTIINQSSTYAIEPWQCVKDEITGLVWEVKTTIGLQSFINRYTWYEPDATKNGGNIGELGAVGTTYRCADIENCNTYEYVNAINALNNGKGLCNSNQWRLPLREELRSLVDYSVTVGPMIDTNFFPNTNANDTWTAQSAFYQSSDEAQAWEIHFDTGVAEAHRKSALEVSVRLVR